MKQSPQTRKVAVAAGVLWGFMYSLPAQSPVPLKPSAAVSALPVAKPTGQTVPTETTMPAARARHIEVNYADGKLAVQATNASLNEILREVARQTGMKITGGVADDRVFGSYGPSSPSVVLEALLEGTGSNILLVDDSKGGSELILTPRHGEASPPSPNAIQASESDDSTGPSQYVAPLRPFQVPVANGRGSVGAPPDAQTAAPAFDQNDGTGPKTPQQIYEQLQKTMQQRPVGAPPPQ